MRVLLITCFTFIVITLCGTNAKAQSIYATPCNPQHLVSFAAAKNTNSALISWKVKNEPDSTTFGVEKSIDTGKTFQSIGIVQSNGSGIYSFTDNNPAAGQDQYRLKIQNDHGNSTYSNALTLLFQPMNMASNNIKLYPSPINHDVTVDDDGLDMSPISTQ